MITQNRGVAGFQAHVDGRGYPWYDSPGQSAIMNRIAHDAGYDRILYDRPYTGQDHGAISGVSTIAVQIDGKWKPVGNFKWGFTADFDTPHQLSGTTPFLLMKVVPLMPALRPPGPG